MTQAPDQRPRLLLVDDEPTNLQVLRHILQADYRLLFATDGERALQVAREQRPDLVLLDIMMPHMDGYAVCCALKADAATASIPVIFITALNDSQDETAGFDVGAVDYLRDWVGGTSQVVNGSVTLGLGSQEGTPTPERGVAANLQLGDVDVDTWQALLAGTPAQGGKDAASTLQDYLPNVLALRARSVTAQGRTLHDVVVGGSRQGLVWRANLDARELGGYVEYRQAQAPDAGSARLHARLARMSMPQSAATQVEAMLDAQPASLPALDIVVDDFELRGRRLGRLEVEAQNRALDGGQREWRLAKFNLITPEAQFQASGNWASLQAPGLATGAAAPGARCSISGSTSRTPGNCWSAWVRAVRCAAARAAWKAWWPGAARPSAPTTRP